MPEAKPQRPNAKAAAEDLRSKLGAAMARSQPPPAVLPTAASAVPLVPIALVKGAPPEKNTTRSRLTTIGVPVRDLGRSDEIAAWLQKQTGQRGIGAATVVRSLLRAAKFDAELVTAFNAVRAEDGRRRR